MEMHFSFLKDGPEFIEEFPVCSLYFRLFVHFNYFRPVDSIFLSVKFQLLFLQLMLFNHVLSAHVISIQD